MMVYHVDCFMLGPNPAPAGGFTVCDGSGAVVKRITMKASPGKRFTNNDLELWAVAAAAEMASAHDTIYSDSEVIVKWWVPRGVCKSRPDLNVLCGMTHNTIRDKRLKLLWTPRDENWAGIYNDAKKESHGVQSE